MILFLDDAGYNILILMGKTVLQDFLESFCKKTMSYMIVSDYLLDI
jgi:hypothetical protein